MNTPRVAKTKDFMKKLCHSSVNDGSIKFANVYTEDVKTTFPFKNIVLIVGLNGSGKTRLLKSIRDKKGLIEVSDYENAFYYNPSESNSKRYSESRTILKEVGITSIDDFLSQYQPMELAEDFLSALSSMLGYDFYKIERYEIEPISSNKEDYEDSNLILYAVYDIDDNSKRYTSHLSHGELYCIDLCFTFQIGFSSNNLLLDEPELYLHSFSQKQLFTFLLTMYNQEKFKQLIIATHSLDAIDYFGKENTYITYKEVDNFNLTFSSNTLMQIYDESIPTKRNFLFLVEDGFAALVLNKIISEQCFFKNINFSIIQCNGEGNIYNFIKLCKPEFNIELIPVFDGDINTKEERFLTIERKFKLPGELAPEKEIIKSIKNSQKEFTKKFNIKERVKIQQFLNFLLRNNHHDFFIELSRRTDIPLSHLKDVAFDFWANAEQESIGNFCDDFLKLIS